MSKPSGATTAEPLEGRGAGNADIMFVAERPGLYDEQRRLAFSGDDARLLASLMTEAGIQPSSVYMTYANKVYSRTPSTAGQMREWHDILMAEIEVVKPKVVVSLGAKAFGALGSGTFSTSLGQAIPLDCGAVLLPTFAPGFLLRGNWGVLPLIEAHLEKANAIASGMPTQTLEEASANWVACDTVEAVETLRDYLLGADCIALDSETTGLNWMTDEILCVSFSALHKDARGRLRPCGMGFTVPVRVKHDKGNPDCETELFWDDEDVVVVDAALRDILGSDIPKAIQNSGFDIRFFERGIEDRCVTARSAYGWEINNLAYDTYLLQRLADENLPANETVMLSLYTDMPYYEGDIKEASVQKRHMADAPDEMLWEYAAADADGLARLLPPLLRRCEGDDVMWIHDNISIPMVRATWNMTRRGIPVDAEYFTRLCDRYRVLVDEAREALKEWGDFNPNSAPQLQRVLFQELGLPQSGRKTQAAKACWDCDQGDCGQHDSTGKDALLDIKQMMIERGQEPHPILDAILNFKTVSKRKSVYVDGSSSDGGILQYIRPDGCIHPEFGVNKADTGRLAAIKPAIQTIPKRVNDSVLLEKDALRRPYVAPDGCFLLEADWNQGEVWVMAYESGDEQLMQLLLSGQDVHTYVARALCRFGNRVFPRECEEPELSNKEWAAKYDHLRGKAKVFVFGLDYGMTEVGAAARLGCTIDEAAQLIELFLSQVFPGLRAHFDRVRRIMEESGFLVNRFLRRGRFGDVNLIRDWGGFKGQQQWEARFRKGVNLPIQSGLNDLHMLAQVRLENSEALKERYAIILAVHDSVLGPTVNDDLDFTVDTAWMIKEMMQDTARNTIVRGEPLGWEIPVELKWGRSWGNLNWTLTPAGEVIPPKEG